MKKWRKTIAVRKHILLIELSWFYFSFKWIKITNMKKGLIHVIFSLAFGYTLFTNMFAKGLIFHIAVNQRVNEMEEFGVTKRLVLGRFKKHGSFFEGKKS